MKEMDELDLPETCRYSDDHEYAQPINGLYRVGLNDYAQDQLGDIVYLDLPEKGDRFEQGMEFGTVESVKAVVELYMPVGGEVVSVNSMLENSPELVNQDPYGRGWMIEVKADDPGAFERLMTSDIYRKMMKEQA